MAPHLTYKCCFPTSSERQNVPLMLKVFNGTTAVGLQHHSSQTRKDTLGTQNFILVFSKLWKILDNRSLYKHIRHNDKDRRPITSTDDDSMTFLRRMIDWLEMWKSLKQPGREGCLTNETYTALRHTLKVMCAMADHYLTAKRYNYILFGKFQTDPLEHRFSKYRSMAGSNYHVAVQEILNSEKKLKAISALKMIAQSNGAISMNTISSDFVKVTDEKKEQMCQEYLQFLSCLDSCDSINITQSEINGMVVMAGYCIHKNIALFSKCNGCLDMMCVDKTLEVELAQKSNYEYLESLDRGCLKWLSEDWLNCVVEGSKVF